MDEGFKNPNRQPRLAPPLICGILAALTLTCTSIAFAEEKPAPSSADTIADVIKGLASTNFAEREAAQRKLESLPVTVEALRDLAAGQTDGEVKLRLDRRITQLAVDKVLHPPRLTVDLKAADLKTLTTTLNEQLHGRYYLQPKNGGSFTINARNASIWDIMEQAAKNEKIQFGISRPSQSQIEFSTTPVPAFGTLWQYHAGDGVAGVALVRSDILEIRLLLDPRIVVHTYSKTATLTELHDSDGKDLLPLVQSGADKLEPTNPMPYSITINAPVKIPQKPGTTISFKGSLHAVIVLEEETLLIRDIEKNPYQTIPFHGNSVIINKHPQEYEGNQMVATRLGTDEPIRLRYRKKNGDMLYEILPPAGGIYPILPEGVDLELSTPKKTAEIQIPFELKNVPTSR